MGDCEQASRLTSYYDGEMPESARAEFEAHLRVCPLCAAELERMAMLSKLLRSARPAQMPLAAVRRMHGRVDSLPAISIRHIAEALTAVAATILIACTVGLMRQTPAEAAPATAWEKAAVTQQVATSTASGSEEQLTSWMIEGLSGSSASD